MKKPAARPKKRKLKVDVKDLQVGTKGTKAAKGGFNPQPEPPTKLLRSSFRGIVQQ
jgi:hypothetical protein